MRPPKFAIEAENSITSSIYRRPPKFYRSRKLYYIINIFMPPKFAISREAAGNSITSSIYLCEFAIEAKNFITSSIYLCDLLSLQ